MRQEKEEGTAGAQRREAERAHGFLVASLPRKAGRK